MLEKLFTSKSRVKILHLLFFDPHNEFHLREISRRTGVSAPHIKKELENLKEINLVTERREGNLKLFKINKSSPIFDELKRIFIKTESVGNLLRKKFEELKVKYSLIYGSFASGKESELSDIDLLIIGNIKEKEVLEIIRKSEKIIGREINYILWNENEFEKRAREKHHLLFDIIKKPIIMLAGDKNEFRKAVKG